MFTDYMKKLLLIIALVVAFPTMIQAGPNGRELESWFGLESRDKIQTLHDHLKAVNKTNLGEWDYTTVWDVREKNYSFEGLRVVRLLTDSRETSGMGCCYSHAAGMILEIDLTTNLKAIEEKYDCYQPPDSIAINGLHFYGHENEGNYYAELRCTTF